MIPVKKLVPVKAFKQNTTKNGDVSSILLYGEWLAAAGFNPDDSAEVAIYKNTLIIRHVINDKE